MKPKLLGIGILCFALDLGLAWAGIDVEPISEECAQAARKFCESKPEAIGPLGSHWVSSCVENLEVCPTPAMPFSSTNSWMSRKGYEYYQANEAPLRAQ